MSFLFPENRQEHPRSHCLFCEQVGEWRVTDPQRTTGFMVWDKVWQQEARLHPKAGIAHLACLEKHLGRELVPADFSYAPLNYLGFLPECKRPTGLPSSR